MKNNPHISCALMLSFAACASSSLFAETDQDRRSIEEVVVKGEKIERSLQETVSSVAVFDAETIDTQNFTDVFDLINQTANVAGIGDDNGFSIRGLRNNGVGGNATSDVATVYLDGVFLPDRLFENSPLNLWDVESVEIFRGPQSTIQGRNALIGAIVARTKDPSSEFSGDAQIRFAEFDSLRASGALSIPLVSDQLALRISGDVTETDGFVENLNLGTDDAAGGQTATLRGKLLFTPQAAPDFSAKLNFTHIDTEKEEADVEEGLFPNQRITTQNLPDLNESDTALASLEISYDFGDAFNLTSVSSFIDNESFLSFDLDSTADGPEDPVDNLQDDAVFSQEIRFTFQTDRWEGLIGAYYFDSDSDNENSAAGEIETDFGAPDPTTLAQIAFGTLTPTPEQVMQTAFLRGVLVDLVPEFNFSTGGILNEEIENAAIFGEVSFDVTDKLTLTAGARFDFENIVQDFALDQQVAPIDLNAPPGLLDPVSEGFLLDLIAQTSAAFSGEINLDADNDFSAFLPKGVVTYNWTDNLSTSFSVQRAYRAGGLSFNNFRINVGAEVEGFETQEDLEAAGIVSSFDPEFTTNFELSLRSQWLDQRLTVNANIFYIDYEDQQINLILSPNALDTLTDNVGNSTLQGFELEAFATPINGLDLFINVGLADTEFEDNSDLFDLISLIPNAAPQVLTGNRFPGAPDLTIGMGGRYTHDSGFYGNLRVRFNGEAEGDTNNAPSSVVESHTIVDAIFGYEINDYFTVEIFADNLLDEQFLATNPIVDQVTMETAEGGLAVPGEQRTVGARFGFSF